MASQFIRGTCLCNARCLIALKYLPALKAFHAGISLGNGALIDNFFTGYNKSAGSFQQSRQLKEIRISTPSRVRLKEAKWEERRFVDALWRLVSSNMPRLRCRAHSINNRNVSHG